MAFAWIEQKNQYNVPEWWCYIPVGSSSETAIMSSKVYYDGFDGWTGCFYNFAVDNEPQECSETHFDDQDSAMAWCEFAMQTVLDFDNLYGE